MKIETIIVTGNIGSGKSRALAAIKELAQTKVEFFNFDDFTKVLYQQEGVKDFLTVMFGTTDKDKISDIVFKTGRSAGKIDTSQVMLEMLNDFFFNKVEEKFLELVNRKPTHTLVIEMPMFFEMKEKSTAMQLLRNKVKVIAVTCNEAIRMERVNSRDNFSTEKIKTIVSSQLPQEFKAEHSDYVIDTTANDTKNLIKNLMESHFKKVFFNVSTV